MLRRCALVLLCCLPFAPTAGADLVIPGVSFGLGASAATLDGSNLTYNETVNSSLGSISFELVLNVDTVGGAPTQSSLTLGVADAFLDPFEQVTLSVLSVSLTGADSPEVTGIRFDSWASPAISTAGVVDDLTVSNPLGQVAATNIFGQGALIAANLNLKAVTAAVPETSSFACVGAVGLLLAGGSWVRNRRKADSA